MHVVHVNDHIPDLIGVIGVGHHRAIVVRALERRQFLPPPGMPNRHSHHIVSDTHGFVAPLIDGAARTMGACTEDAAGSTSVIVGS